METSLFYVAKSRNLYRSLSINVVECADGQHVLVERYRKPAGWPPTVAKRNESVKCIGEMPIWRSNYSLLAKSIFMKWGDTSEHSYCSRSKEEDGPLCRAR